MNKHSDIIIDIGMKIREIRTRLGLSIRELAERVGISYLTMQRIETDRISPSVVVLAKISACLSFPLHGFLSETKRAVVHVKTENQNVVKTRTMLLKLVGPKGVVNDNISIVHGKAEKGKLVGRHKHPGFELAYVLKGRALHKQGGNVYEMSDGDLIFFDAGQSHEVIALELHEWLGVQFYSDTLRLGDEHESTQEDVSPQIGPTDDRSTRGPITRTERN
jgi:quercetin dioxygenase-like cupin family protein